MKNFLKVALLTLFLPSLSYASYKYVYCEVEVEAGAVSVLLNNEKAITRVLEPGKHSIEVIIAV